METYLYRLCIVWSTIVLYRQVNAIEVRSVITYPTENSAEIQCNWNIDDLPVSLFFVRKDNDIYFTLDLTHFPYPCIRGLPATSPVQGSASMTILELQPSDEGKYRCHVLKFSADGLKPFTNVSDSFLYIQDAKARNPKMASNSNGQLAIIVAILTTLVFLVTMFVIVISKKGAIIDNVKSEGGGPVTENATTDSASYSDTKTDNT
ncbi:hypothetical protein Btru_041105 [Bulinus truncatus]|nr:hypothetical protein Btru_041105 [Bulinus truncatus]